MARAHHADQVRYLHGELQRLPWECNRSMMGLSAAWSAQLYLSKGYLSKGTILGIHHAVGHAQHAVRKITPPCMLPNVG